MTGTSPRPQGLAAHDTTPAVESARETVWDYCEIRIGYKGGYFSDYFIAVDQHNHIVAKSNTFPGGIGNGHSNETRNLNLLVDNLIRAGWQPLPQGPYYYSFRFRRPVSPTHGADGLVGTIAQFLFTWFVRLVVLVLVLYVLRIVLVHL